MNFVSKDEFYYKSELAKSNNTLLMYASSLTGHFDKKMTLGEILMILSGEEFSIEKDTVFCKIETNVDCKLSDIESEDSHIHCFIDCSMCEILSLFYGKTVMFDANKRGSKFSTLLSAVLQYGVYNRSSFPVGIGFDKRIDSVKLVFKNVREYSTEDVMEFISHLYFVE